MSDTDHDLDSAYALSTPEDSVNYYRDWAVDYDDGFAVTHGYIVPKQVARVFRAAGGAGPALDIGAGTGLVAAELSDVEMDGIDISPEMLAVAGEKGRYRNRICADLTAPLPEIADASYQAFTSAGTFTHGHVGPVCLPELMRIARPGALFVLAINEQVFDSEGFGSAFATLVARGQISPVTFHHVGYYEGADHPHAEDMGLIAEFRRI